MNEGVLLSFTISGTDIDTDDTLSYYVYNMPTGAVLNANTGLFTWTPNYVQAGVYNTVTFRVIDPYGLYDDEIITITVNNVPAPPTITTEPATGIDVNLTTLNGTVNPNELSTTAYFQWGISANYGATTTAQALGNGASILNVSQVITGLEHNSTYYFRIAATNIIGTSYGQSRSFTTGTNTNWAMVVGGETHSMGIKNDGSLWAWGDNSDGQLGLADTISRTTPTRVGALNTWVEVACGSGFTIARKNNHTLWGSGDNSEGQLGLGALTQTLSFMQIGTDTDWTRITAGGQSHTMALKENKTLYTWGDNARGQLGFGDYTNRTTPQVVTTTTVSFIAAGYDHSMAIMGNGSLYAWGANSSAQLGTGDYVTRTTPTLITTTSWTKVSGGYGHTMAINSIGNVYGWGLNAEGELGTGDVTTRTTPTIITTSGWTDVSVGYKHTIARKSDGKIYTWGDNSDGQLGLGDLVSRTAPTLITNTGTVTWTRTSAGWRFTVGIKDDNSVWRWGDNQYGQLGLGDTVDKTSPIYNNSPWVEVESGIFHTLARKANGTIWGTGYNQSGQLGLGTTTSISVFTQTGTGTDWAEITAGSYHSMARKSNGTIWSWGWNYGGCLGLGGVGGYIWVPTQIGTDTDWGRIEASDYNSYAIKSNGTLWAWGTNFSGTPIQLVTDTDWVNIMPNAGGALFLKSNRTLWTVSSGSAIQIGTDSDWADARSNYGIIACKTNGTLWSGWPPTTQVGTDTDWVEVDSSNFISNYARKANGTLWRIPVSTWILVQIGSDADWVELNTGDYADYHRIARKSNGTIWTWGQNIYGDLGLGFTSQSEANPTQVPQ